jgi:hypothetical protein
MSRHEQPDYSVVATYDGYEVRRYESYLAAETTVRGDFDSVGNTAFHRLAGFIFGRNSEGQNMNMTVPVTREQTEANAYQYRFVMEKAYSEKDLPRPVDDSVELVRVPAGCYAASRYRGRSNESQYRRAEAAPLDALHRGGIKATGTPSAPSTTAR